MNKLLVTVLFGIIFVAGSVPPALATPQPPQISYTASGLNITISWTTSVGATGYTLCYAPYPWQPWMTMNDIGYIDMGATNSVSFYLWEGAAYYLAVQAYDAQGPSNFSNLEYFIMGPPTPEWVDDDGDGYHENSGDCNDASAAVHPAATELCGNGIDEDCNSFDTVCPENIDNDLDGYTESQGDCNDANGLIHPGTTEWNCGDGLDNNCDGHADAADTACQVPVHTLTDTGQSLCYAANGTVTGCAGTGQDGEFSRNPMSLTDSGSGTVTDNVTGLIWQKLDDNAPRTLVEAVSYCENLTLGGSTNWRLPNLGELLGIVDYGAFNPAISPLFSGTDATYYWSSTHYAVNQDFAWRVNFDKGSVSLGIEAPSGLVRCVRQHE